MDFFSLVATWVTYKAVPITSSLHQTTFQYRDSFPKNFSLYLRLLISFYRPLKKENLSVLVINDQWS